VSAPENEVLVSCITEAMRAIAHALKVFRRLNELGAFGVGAIEASVSRDDEFVVVARNRVQESIEDLAPRLLDVAGPDGVPLDVRSSIVTHVGDSTGPEVGRRGGTLYESLIEFLGSLGKSDSAGCVKALEGLEGHVQSIAIELGVPLGEPTPGTTRSEDFSTVLWRGERFVFTATQARCVAALWPEWEKGGLGLREDTIGERVGSDARPFRLDKTFQSRDGVRHPAWDRMIVQVAKGVYALAGDPPTIEKTPDPNGIPE